MRWHDERRNDDTGVCGFAVTGCGTVFEITP
jgi:hypothetical protein